MLTIDPRLYEEPNKSEVLDKPFAGPIDTVRGIGQNVADFLDVYLNPIFYGPANTIKSWLTEGPEYYNEAGQRVTQSGEPVQPGERNMYASKETPQPTYPGGGFRPPPQDLAPPPTKEQQYVAPVRGEVKKATGIKNEGWGRGIPNENGVSTDLAIYSPEEEDFVEKRIGFYKPLGFTDSEILGAVQDELRQFRNEKRGPTIQTPSITPENVETVQARPGGEGGPEGIISQTIQGAQAPTTPTPTWTPKPQTDWAAKYEAQGEAALPKWGELPQMKNLPEYKPPAINLLNMLTAAMFGAGMGAIGKDPYDLMMNKFAIDRAQVEKRRAEARGDITSQREYELKRAEILNNTKLKGIEMRKSQEDKAVQDELNFYDMAIKADKTGTLINQLAPRIMQLHGLAPGDVESLRDPQTGQYKIAKSAEEMELDKFNAGVSLRNTIIKQHGTELGLTDPKDIATYRITGKLPEDLDLDKFLAKKALQAYQSGDLPGYQQLMRLRQQNKLAMDETMIREDYRYKEAMEDLKALKGKVPDDLWNALWSQAQAYHQTGHGLPSMPKDPYAKLTTSQKLDPIYQDALAALDPDQPALYNRFVQQHDGMTPEVFMQMYEQGKYKVSLPSNATDLAISRAGYKNADALKDELRAEAIDFNNGIIKSTPLRDQWIREAEPHIRALYGRYIRRIEESLNRSLNAAEVAKFYDDVQVNGPPQFGRPAEVKKTEQQKKTETPTKKEEKKEEKKPNPIVNRTGA